MGWSGSGGITQGWDNDGGGGATITQATFIAASVHQFAAASETFAFPAGAQAGDILLVMNGNGFGGGEVIATSSDSAALNQIQFDFAAENSVSLWFKILTAAEITNGNLSITTADTSSGCLMGIWRNAGGFTSAVKGSGPLDVNNTTTMAFPGFNKSANSAGVVLLAMDRDSGAGVSDDGGFTSRLISTTNNFAWYARDKLSGYANATVTVSGLSNNLGTSGFKVGWLVDLVQ